MKSFKANTVLRGEEGASVVQVNLQKSSILSNKYDELAGYAGETLNFESKHHLFRGSFVQWHLHGHGVPDTVLCCSEFQQQI